jgi:hypothetical protein
MYRVDREKDALRVINTTTGRVVYTGTLDSYLTIEGKQVKLSSLTTDDELLRALAKNGTIK